MLPPVSRLSSEQAMKQFLAGYTAKVAGTEMGVTEPEATFSACFGAAFLVRHPKVYGEMLAKKMEAHDAKAWLVNTGWSGGGYGVGERMKLAWTRAIIDAIHDGSLNDAETSIDPFFGLSVPTACSGVPAEILNPKNTWADASAYDTAAKKLATDAGHAIRTIAPAEQKRWAARLDVIRVTWIKRAVAKGHDGKNLLAESRAMMKAPTD